MDSFHWDVLDFRLRDHSVETLMSLFEYDLIFVNGGFSGYLAKMMRKSGFDKLLPKLLEKGIVYVGSSAGSMVMSDVQDASSWYLGEPEPEALTIPGLGYIDFQFYPHVKDATRNVIAAHCNPLYTYYLMRDGTALSISDSSIAECGLGIEIIPRKV